MMDRVRIGVIGTGRVVNSLHLPYLRSHPQAEIVALCGRNRQRAEGVAARFGVPHVFTDYREMIEKGDLDAVVIAAPDIWHYPMAMEALNAGLHVLCEKPLASNAVQAKEIYEKAEMAGVKHMVFFTYRGMPYYRYLKELLEEGYVGRPYHCHIHYLIGYARQPYYDWRWDPSQAAGVLSDLGPHMVDFARWYVGEVSRVSATLDTFVERSGPDGKPFTSANDSAMLLLHFENGAQGVLHVSGVAHIGERGQEQRIALYGEAGTLELLYTRQGSDPARGIRKTTCQILVVRHNEEKWESLQVPDSFWGDVDRSSAYNVFFTQSVGDRLFVDAILHDLPLSPSFYDGFRVQQVLDAALESHRTGCWTPVC